MIRRIITAATGIPVLALIIGFGRPWHFFLLMVFVTGIALWEYFTMVFSQESVERLSGAAGGVLVFLGATVAGFSLFVSITAILAIGAILMLLCKQRSAPGKGRLLWSLLGLLYVGYLYAHWVFLYDSPNGRQWVFFVLVIVMGGDAAGYFVGRRFGRRKIYPRISPNKTFEGTWAILIAGVVVGILASRFFLPELSLGEVLGLSLLFSLLGMGGDLLESWMKRSFSVKDSGVVLPGHGGLLDRMDSLVFPAVMATHYVRLFQP